MRRSLILRQAPFEKEAWIPQNFSMRPTSTCRPLIKFLEVQEPSFKKVPARRRRKQRRGKYLPRNVAMPQKFWKGFGETSFQKFPQEKSSLPLAAGGKKAAQVFARLFRKVLGKFETLLTRRVSKKRPAGGWNAYNSSVPWALKPSPKTSLAGVTMRKAVGSSSLTMSRIRGESCLRATQNRMRLGSPV